jgi:hypothetical protein
MSNKSAAELTSIANKAVATRRARALAEKRSLAAKKAWKTRRANG